MYLRYYLLLSMFAFSKIGFAHTGHGSPTSSGVIHYLTSPLHLFTIALAFGLGIWFYRKLKAEKAE